MLELLTIVCMAAAGSSKELQDSSPSFRLTLSTCCSLSCVRSEVKSVGYVFAGAPHVHPAMIAIIQSIESKRAIKFIEQIFEIIPCQDPALYIAGSCQTYLLGEPSDRYSTHIPAWPKWQTLIKGCPEYRCHGNSSKTEEIWVLDVLMIEEIFLHLMLPREDDPWSLRWLEFNAVAKIIPTNISFCLRAETDLSAELIGLA